MRLISLKKDNSIRPNDEINYYLNPDFIYIPIGNANINDRVRVYKNMLIKDGILSPISGITLGVEQKLFTKGKSKVLVIKNDYRELQVNRKKEHYDITKEGILKALGDTKNKNILAKLKGQNKFRNIIISAIDDGVYVFNKIFILKENINELLELFDKLSLIYKSDNNYLVVKNTDTNIITECLNYIGTYPNIKLILVNDEYLLGKEEFLVKKLQVDGSTLFMDTNELLTLSNILHEKDDTTMMITVSGDALEENIVFRIKKYSAFKEIMPKLKLSTEDFEVVCNGLMQGMQVDNWQDLVIDEDMQVINIMKKQKKVSSECINCGKCIEICPTGVNPLSGKNIDKCINCGLCSYICPGYVNLKEKLKGYLKDER